MNSTTTVDVSARRPIKARQSRWAAASATWLVRRNVSPNSISVASAVFSAAGGACLVVARLVHRDWAAAVLYLLAAAGIQLRLVCNLLDGMVAVEGGKAGKAGEIYNDFPDRLADPALLAAAGYGVATLPWGIDLGWAAAAMALLTAYTRVLGRSAGSGVYFTGPMAKQHRMAVMTAACLAAAVAAVLSAWGLVPGPSRFWPLWAALVVVVIGCVVTIVRRLKLITGDLQRK